MNSIKFIAFYLPQFHPTPDNDIWWGKGFTEWTNVCKAKPLFRGHIQPHIPADLGFYDLRLEETRIAQANLAKEYGIDGFCYYHYWFGNGKRELELPFNEVLKTGKPDFPFMLCWANESWHAKFWNKDGKATSKKMLVEQTYPGKEDYIAHFEALLPAFKDRRYIKIDNKLLFMLYRPLDFKDVSTFIDTWQNLAKENGFDGFIFIGQSLDTDDKVENDIYNAGFDYVNTVNLYKPLAHRSILKKCCDTFVRYMFQKPFICAYKDAIKYFVTDRESKESVIPTIIPNWDHTPRSKFGGYVLHKSNPEYFAKHIKQVLATVENKKSQLVFIKSWNEWGEGNYLEPDLQYGLQYLEKIKKAKE